jgi:hypothetical protein
MGRGRGELAGGLARLRRVRFAAAEGSPGIQKPTPSATMPHTQPHAILFDLPAGRGAGGAAGREGPSAARAGRAGAGGAPWRGKGAGPRIAGAARRGRRPAGVQEPPNAPHSGALRRPHGLQHCSPR